MKKPYSILNSLKEAFLISILFSTFITLFLMFLLQAQLNNLNKNLLETEERTDRKIDFAVSRIGEQLQLIRKGEKK
jgi:hypothetical protein